MKIIVTGSDGYIARGTILRFLENGCDVVGVGLKACGIQDSRFEEVVGDIFADEFDLDYNDAVLLHLAWRDGFNHYAPSHLEDLPHHHRFIKKVAQAGIKRITIMGSMHEVGYYEGAVDENTPCKSTTPYGVAKNALRQLAIGTCEKHEVELQWLRGFYLYSNDGRGNSIFAKIMKAAKEGQNTFPFTTGKNKYDFLPYEEFCDQIVAATMQDEVSGIINICSGKPVSLAEQIETFIEKNSLDISLEYGKYPDRAYDSPAIWGDSRKIHTILGRREV